MKMMGLFQKKKLMFDEVESFLNNDKIRKCN